MRKNDLDWPGFWPAGAAPDAVPGIGRGCRRLRWPRVTLSQKGGPDFSELLEPALIAALRMSRADINRPIAGNLPPAAARAAIRARRGGANPEVLPVLPERGGTQRCGVRRRLASRYRGMLALYMLFFGSANTRRTIGSKNSSGRHSISGSKAGLS